MRYRITIYLIILLVTLPSCTNYTLRTHRETYPLTSPWTYTDLRALDENDASEPGMDMLAAYVRDIGDELQIRLDFLDLNEVPDFDLYLVIDSQPGGKLTLSNKAAADLEWDTLFIIHAAGDIRIINNSSEGNEVLTPDAGVRVMRDPVLDTITIAFNQNIINVYGYTQAPQSGSSIHQPFAFQVFITKADSPDIADKLDAVSSDAPPPQPVPVLFTFWNSYPAYTPALALRRWDGAHTGPQGGRHGLYNLLRTARSAGIPLLLLDLNNPFSMSALDYAGKLDMVSDMVDNGQLLLPEALPASNALSTPPSTGLLAQLHRQNQSVSTKFNFPRDQTIFSPYGLTGLRNWVEAGGGKDIRLVFVPSNSAEAFSSDENPTSGDRTTVYRWREFKVVPVPGYGSSTGSPEQATSSGPSLETRQALINTALANNQNTSDSSPILVLGGELPGSSWGIPQLARATFRYINNRPWIKPVSANDLPFETPDPLPETFTITDPDLLVSDPTEEELLTQLVDDLESIPPNNLTTAAWQAIMSLYAPVYPTSSTLPSLRAGYLGQAGALVSAARWAHDPLSQADCTSDLDYDGLPECILASNTLYTIIEIENSALTYTFYLDQDGGAHQLIAPSSQFITGLSDPTRWDPGTGLGADPAVIDGAFVGPSNPDKVQIDNGYLTFSWRDSNIESKTYRLLEEGIRIEYVTPEGIEPTNTHLPLALDPWRRFESGWAEAYRPEEGRENLSWEIEPGVYVTVHSSALVTLHSFIDSLDLLSSPEDPNRDYPAGHFTPFPMVILELFSEGDFYTQIDISH